MYILGEGMLYYLVHLLFYNYYHILKQILLKIILQITSAKQAILKCINVYITTLEQLLVRHRRTTNKFSRITLLLYQTFETFYACIACAAHMSRKIDDKNGKS